jgi:hypothetical protein
VLLIWFVSRRSCGDPCAIVPRDAIPRSPIPIAPAMLDRLVGVDHRIIRLIQHSRSTSNSQSKRKGEVVMSDPAQIPNRQNAGQDAGLLAVLDKVYKKLGEIVEEIVVLRVTTVVGTVTAQGAGDVDTNTTINIAPENQLVAHLAVNTALGDTNVIISKGFMEDATLAAIHKQAIADALTIRKESIEMLRSTVQMIAERLGG